MPGALEARLDEAREDVGRHLLQAHHRTGLVERPLRADHLLHQRRLRAGEDVADLPLILHRRAQRVLDVAAVELRQRLEFVERDHHAPLLAFGDVRRQREHFLGEPRDVAIRARRRKRQRDLRAAARLHLVAHFRPDRGEHFLQPRARAIGLRFERHQRPRVAFEKRHVRAEAADRQLHGQHLLLRERREHVADQRRLAVAARRDQEDLLAAGEIADQPAHLVGAIDERIERHDFAVDERILLSGHDFPLR